MRILHDPVKMFSILLISLGAIFLAARLAFGARFNLALPLVFLMLGGVFFLLVFAIRPTWKWADLLFLPACLLMALGMIFLINLLTGDRNSWAYAWLLLPASLGVGLALASRGPLLPRRFLTGGLVLAVVSITLFALFGVIAGGVFIQVMAPILLIAGGLSLRWLPLEQVLPAPLRGRRISPTTAPSPLATSAAEAPPESTRQPAPLVEPLSPREMEVLRLVGAGLSNQQIAEQLHVASSTVKTHINNIYGKLGVETRIQAVRRAQEYGLIDS